MSVRTLLIGTVLCALAAAPALATAEFVEHNPASAAYGETGVTERFPAVPREDESVDIWVRIGYSFYYDNVAVYYTTDGSVPAGSKGTPTGSTQVVTSASGGINFVRNEPTAGGNADWWKGTLPASTRDYGTTVKYIIGAWHSGGGAEVFANNTGCSDGTCDNPAAPATVFSYTVKLAWPGKGSPFADHTTGYPVTRFWQEEAVTGNNYMNVQLDQNGSVYDVYYPSAGCVNGMGTKNEGYSDGADTFPPGIPVGNRGQMNLNSAMGGLRVDGKTYWQTNQDGTDYGNVAQEYVADTNVVATSSRLVASGNNIAIQQYDFCPKGIAYPNDKGGAPNRGIYVKRFVLTNSGAADKTIGFYYFMDPALNGGDSYDGMFTDATRGAMVAFDNTHRFTSASGEYNPTTYGDYEKNVSIYLATALKVTAIGAAGGAKATDFWSDTSSDQGQGWIGAKVSIPAGGSVEVDVAIVGGFDAFSGATGTYDYQVAPALDWFLAGNMADQQAATETYWRNWLASGVQVSLPDAKYNALFNRGLLGTALHLDAKGGGVVAGMHNGAYPFVWPRDAVYAAITLDRTGHTFEAAEVYRFLKDVAYRASDTWGKGFWFQKYTTDGYKVWTAPQVDETACVPWGVKYHHDVTGDDGFLSSYYGTVYEAARAASESSSIDSRLYYDALNHMMHSNNVWEDSWDDFLYSNGQVERGLRDAAALAARQGHSSDATLFSGRADDIHTGIIGRLNWDGENTDISQLGLVYPFRLVSPVTGPMVHVPDRMNGGSADRNGNVLPLVNNSGEFTGLINRYWGDGYWGGGPWFLSTAWYGLYYLERADTTSDKVDIDVHKSKMDLLINALGPNGLGAEQISPAGSASYQGFRLQTAWPNAWESMSTLVDGITGFLGYEPDVTLDAIRIKPKLPTGWSNMTFNGLVYRGNKLNVTVTEEADRTTTMFTNVNGTPARIAATIRTPSGTRVVRVTLDGQPVEFLQMFSGTPVTLIFQVKPGIGSVSMLVVRYQTPYVLADAVNALKIAGGLVGSSGTDVARLDADFNTVVDVRDAVKIGRGL